MDEMTTKEIDEKFLEVPFTMLGVQAMVFKDAESVVVDFGEIVDG